MAVLRFRVRGWNGAEMSPVADATWALDQLARAVPGPCRSALLGHSMGGRTALRVGGHSAVTAVAGLAPWLPPSEPSAQLAGRSVLLAHGTADRMTDPAATAGFAARLRAEGTPVAVRRGSPERGTPWSGGRTAGTVWHPASCRRSCSARPAAATSRRSRART